MKDMSASRGVPIKGNLMKNRLKFLVPFCVVMTFLAWNSSLLIPFSGVKINSGGPYKDIVAGEAEIFGASPLQHKDKINIKDGLPVVGVLPGQNQKSTKETMAAQDNVIPSTTPVRMGNGPQQVSTQPSVVTAEESEVPAAAEPEKVDNIPEQVSTQHADGEGQWSKEPAMATFLEEAALEEDGATAAELKKDESVPKQGREDVLPQPADSGQAWNSESMPVKIVEEWRIKEEAKQSDTTEVKKDEIEPSPEIVELESDEWDLVPFHEEGLEQPGNLSSTVNVVLARIFNSIRTQSLPHSIINHAEQGDSSCEGKKIFVYDLPTEFNAELEARCDTLFPWFNLCDFFTDSGIGKPVYTRDNGSQIFVPADRWFNTHQYALELVSHARIKKYKCLTKDPNQASLFYIPYYAGLDVIRWHFTNDSTNEKRDELGLKLVRWLEKQPSWTRRGGLDHVMVLGKISWDFRRLEGGTWGSRLLEFKETQKVTKVLIERNPWARKDIGVPHPTFFHPRSAADIDTWLKHISAQQRTSLVTFVGKGRPGTTNVRQQLVEQCVNATSEDECRFVECNSDLCLHPAFVTKAFLTTHFCMQPVGDSPTRRSLFDSMIAGCIPVLFHPWTAYVQYVWHLPANESSWSVYISEDEVKAGNANVIDILKRISPAERDARRETIVNTIIPGLLYSAPGSDVSPYRDAFDITIDNLLHRVSRLPPLPQVAST